MAGFGSRLSGLFGGKPSLLNKSQVNDIDPKTGNFRKALTAYKNAIGNLQNYAGIFNKLNSVNKNGEKYSEKLLKSIAQAFSKSKKAAAAVNSLEPGAPEGPATQAVTEATNQLNIVTNNLKREVLTANNLNTIMKQIISNSNNTNKRAEAYIEKRGNNKIDANSKLNSARGNQAQWTAVLNAARQKIPSPLPTRRNELLAQAAAPEKNYTQMSTQNLLGESMKNNLSSANKKRLFEALQVERMRLGGLNNDTSKTNRTLVQAAINRLKPKQLTLRNRVGGFARGIGSLTGGAVRALTGKTQPNSK